MALRDFAFRALNKVRRQLGKKIHPFDLDDYLISPAQRAALFAAESEGLQKVFCTHRGRTLEKWAHYLDVYERYFAAYRNTPVKMLEIGVTGGGSLELWRNYFGESATIYGIDINPECAQRVTPPNQVRIGSQDDPEFLRRTASEMVELDIVLDDGSHFGKHQRVSFEVLFPFVRDGGLYVIEDLHMSYVPGLPEGGYRRKGTGIEYIKRMIDDMHSWYHQKSALTPAKEQIRAIHIFDSIVVIEKRKIERPSRVVIDR